jgi:hypothetical protein
MSLFDAIPVVIGLFIAGIMIVIAMFIMSGINEAVQAIDSPEAARAKTIATDTNDALPWVLDFFFLMLLITMPLASMILAFLNNIPPFFFWASIGVMLLVILLGGAFGEAWASATTDTLVQAQVSRIPMTNYVLNNFGIYSLFVITIIAAGVFIKTRSQGGYYQ